MNANTRLSLGLSGFSELVVTEEHTAPHVGSGVVPVLATPVMVNLMEAAALDAVECHLPAGSQTLGILLNVRHTAATPIGMRVRASATLIAINARTLTFQVEAEDEKELIGDGIHERVIVNAERFAQRVAAKANKE
jgi:predicted thioesterase